MNHKFFNYLDAFKIRIDNLRFFVRSNLTKNLTSKISFKKNKPILNDIQKQILSSIKEKGYASSSLTELFGFDNNFLELFQDLVKDIKSSEGYKRSLEYFKNNINISGKHYIYRFEDNKNIKIDLNSVLIKFILSNQVIDIVNSYFDMYSKLNTTDRSLFILTNQKNNNYESFKNIFSRAIQRFQTISDG